MCLFVLTLLPMAAYFNSLQGSFQYDDAQILEQPWTSDFDHFRRDVVFLFGKEGLDLSAIAHRPVLLLTFVINNVLHPRQVLGFHLVNLLLHVLVTVLVFMIVGLSGELLDRASGAARGQAEAASRSGEQGNPCRSTAMPLTTALLFALHPLATDSVSYISSRSTLLATFFYLAGLYAFLRVFSLPKGRGRWILQTTLAVAVAVLYYLAVASKLTAVTFPVLLGVWFVLIVSPGCFPRLHARLLSPGMLIVYAIVLLVALGVALGFKPRDKGLDMYGQWGYFSTQLKVILFYYLKLFFLPFNQNVDIGFPFAAGTDLKTLLAIMVLSGMVVGVLLKGGPLLKAGTAWFFLTLAPTSSFIPLNDLAVEHRMYLPMSLGPCLIAGLWASKMARPRRLCVWMLLFLTAGVLTTARNRVWLSEISLWQDAMAKSPYSPRPYNNLGKAYYEKNEKERSMAFFLKSTRLSSNFAEPHYNLANVYMDLNRFADAEREYQTAIRLDPEYYAAYLGLGSIYNQTGRYEEAVKNYHLANDAWKLYRPGNYALAKLNLGETYGKLGRLEESIKESRQALDVFPKMHKAYFNLGTAYMKRGDLENAERSFLACLDINSDFEQAQFNLAHLFQLKKDWGKSIQWFEKFLQTQGPDAKAYFGIAWSYQQMKQWAQARMFYEKALTARPDYLSAQINLANVYIQLQQFDQALAHFAKALEQQPGQFRIHVQMGLLYWKTRQDKINARAHFKKALELAPGAPEQKQVAQLIRALSQS
ncbi:MAG: tetratricopeptide repeat protein [Nitrospinales bacterium]